MRKPGNNKTGSEQFVQANEHLCFSLPGLYESSCEKTGLRDFRPGPTQTGLYSY